VWELTSDIWMSMAYCLDQSIYNFVTTWWWCWFYY